LRVSEYPWKTKPYDHQLEAFKAITRLKGKAGLFLDMGLGKTKVVVDFNSYAFLSGFCTRVLVIAPLSVLGVWEREIAAHTPDSVPYSIRRLTGTSEHKAKILHRLNIYASEEKITWILINYEAIWRGEFGQSSKKMSKKKNPANVFAALQKFSFDMVVTDESSKIKDPTANQSKAAHKLAVGARMRLALTGTPIANNPLDLFSQIKFVDEHVFFTEVVDDTPMHFQGQAIKTTDKRSSADVIRKPMTWSEFKQTYAEWGGFEGRQVRSYKNLDDLYGKVRRVSFIRRKEECLDLPEKVFETIPIVLSDVTRKAYEQMSIDMIALVEESDLRIKTINETGIDPKTGEEVKENMRRGRTMAIAQFVIVQILRLYQLACGFIVDVEKNIVTLGQEKLDVTMELVDELMQAGEKVVIFARFQHDVKRLTAALTSKHIDHVAVWGGVSERERTAGVARFQSDPKCKVVVCQIAAGSLGITLHAARTVIFYSLDYSHQNYAQACDRIHRIGQERKCLYYLLVAQDTIEEVVYEALLQKQTFSNVFLGRSMSLVDTLRKQLSNLKLKASAA